MSFTLKFRRIWPVIATICFLAALVSHLYIGSFTRYLADDYCTAGIFNQMGLVEAQRYWYLNWSGRYTFYLMVNLTEFGGLNLVPILPSIAITIWLICLTWVISQWSAVFSVWRDDSLLMSFFLAGLILYASVDGTPNISQSLYWRTGMLTYVSPLLCLTAFIGILEYRLNVDAQKMMWPWLALSFGLNFLAGGFSETYVALQTTILLLAVVLLTSGVFSFRSRSLLLLLWVGLMGSILAMVVVVVAPGNEARLSNFELSTNWVSIMGLSMWSVAPFLAGLVRNSPIILPVSILFPLLLAPYANDMRINYVSALKFFGGLAVIGSLFLLSTFTPAIYGMNQPLPERAQIIPLFILICILVVGSFVLGMALKSFFDSKIFASAPMLILSACIVIILLWFGPVATVRDRIAVVPQAREMAMQWDQRDAQIRQSKSKKVTVSSWPYSAGLEDIGPDPENWVNNCVARYYNLQSIVAQ